MMSIGPGARDSGFFMPTREHGDGKVQAVGQMQFRSSLPSLAEARTPPLGTVAWLRTLSSKPPLRAAGSALNQSLSYAMTMDI